jgi:hypothetical protein
VRRRGQNGNEHRVQKFADILTSRRLKRRVTVRRISPMQRITTAGARNQNQANLVCRPGPQLETAAEQTAGTAPRPPGAQRVQPGRLVRVQRGTQGIDPVSVTADAGDQAPA